MYRTKISVKKLLIIMAAGFALLASMRPALAHSNGPNLLHTETVGQITVTGVTFGPVGANCSAAAGGPACAFVDLDGTETGRNEPLGPFTAKVNATILFGVGGEFFTPNGGHDSNGNPTGFCAPEFGTEIDTFPDGSTLSSNLQGTGCCAAANCPAGLGPPSVNHDSSVITGGTGRLTGVSGGSSLSDNSITGPLLVHSEGVLKLPGDSH